MADEPQHQTIAERIAALKLNQVGRQPAPGYQQTTNGASGRRPPPPPPPRPSVPERPSINGRTLSSNIPPTHEYAPVSNAGVGNLPEGGQTNGMDVNPRPALPARTSTQSSQGPALPPRRQSDSPALPARGPSEPPTTDSRRPSDYSFTRRDSNESTSSVATAQSGLSRTSTATADRMKAPAYDPAALPALPPKRTEEEKNAAFTKYNDRNSAKRSLKPTKSSPTIPQRPIGATPPLPSRPDTRTPSLPSQSDGVPSPPPRERETAPPPSRRSALSMGFGNSANTFANEPPPLPNSRPGSVPQVHGEEHVPQVHGGEQPPPVPTASRPDLAALQASKPKLNGASAAPAPPVSGSSGSCLLCRDYSAPDSHAARFPRQSLPSNDIGWLAQQLTAPFPSPTDKARAIFTWLHHNVAYDTVSFFNNNVRPATPQSTLQSGLAVCEGYAGLFAALAMKVGLEAQVISGHGKGYGYAALKPGDSIPPYSAGHAWNVVKIDGGQWKLIDCCWGAGVVNGKNRPYEKRFAPERFTQSNDEFGLDHYPGDSTKQFRSDGRVVSWPDYITGNKNGCGADFFAGFVAEEGMDKTTFKPTSGKIYLSQQPGPTVRFSFQKVCPHWDPVRCGKGPYHLYILHLEALDGTQRNHIPFETNGDVWWCDVPIQDLGRPGMKAQIFAVTQFDGGDGRGLTIHRYRERKGRCAFAFGGVCMWEIA